jgi:hypothetical protein
MTSRTHWPSGCRGSWGHDNACEIRGLRQGTDKRHAKIGPMDIEDINAIGTLLADLTARTEQLRGYL